MAFTHTISVSGETKRCGNCPKLIAVVHNGQLFHKTAKRGAVAAPSMTIICSECGHHNHLSVEQRVA